MTAHLRSLLDSATPAPWLIDGGRIHLAPDERTLVGWNVAQWMERHDAALIVELRNRAGLMLDIIDAAEDYIAELDREGASDDDALVAALARFREAE